MTRVCKQESWLSQESFNKHFNKILVLGPFMGKPACKRIEFGSGVCGYVAKQLKTEVCVLLIRRELGTYIFLFVFAFQSHWLCCFIDRK